MHSAGYQGNRRLCDRLPNIDLAAGLGNPNELPAREQAIETVRAIVAETKKPVAFIAHDEVEDEEIWNYLAEVAGGWEMLVLSDELAGRARRFVSGVSVDEEHLAVDVTRRCYKTHDFMMDDHTLNYMKTEMRQSSLFPRIAMESWQGEGSPSARSRIREKLQDLLA